MTRVGDEDPSGKILILGIYKQMPVPANYLARRLHACPASAATREEAGKGNR
jgi:hypothetical protein